MGKTCRDCKGPMLWADKVEGGSVPLEPKPVGSGNYVLVEVGHLDRRPLVRYAQSDEPTDPEHPRYVAHSKVCPSLTTATGSQRPPSRTLRAPASQEQRVTVNRMIDDAFRGQVREDRPRRGQRVRRVPGGRRKDRW